MIKSIFKILTIISALFLGAHLFVNCSTKDSASESEIEIVIDDTDFEATDWTEETHSKSASPNFDEVFNDTAVKRFDIVVTEDRWQSMLSNMTSLYGAFGTGGGSGGGSVDIDENPVFVPADIFYNGIEWYKVGVRFKGNSSLKSSWEAGVLKLSFKLDFDEFEDEYPQIDNQRFYGFKKFSLKNNFDDNSMLREKLAGDVFRNAGLASPHAAFYTVYVDHGDGPIYFGLYTLVEEVDNTVIDTQFSSDDGNLYKPDGYGANFEEGSFTSSAFVKKTNEDDLNWTDIQQLFTALHADVRNTDAATWRSNLEEVFDTDTFLKYLAVNTVIQNWDTYGRMTHNYYLYNNPDNNKLTWIPWDNNEALQTGKMGGSLPLNFSSLNNNEWPLIGYLYADAVYKAKYDAYVKEVVNGVFSVATMQSLYATYASLIEPYATSEISGYSFLYNSAAFQAGVSELNSHVEERVNAVNSYLEN